MTEVTQILRAIEQGDVQGAERLLPLVYEELRALAAQKLAWEKPGQTLQATALVHDAYLRLVDTEQAQHWNSRNHFFAAAAEAMRRILIENARRKLSRKRGGDFARQEGELDQVPMPEPREDLLALDDALQRLAAEHQEAARVVELRYFGGLTLPEVAEACAISPRTAGRLWAFARAWLRREVEGEGDVPGS